MNYIILYPLAVINVLLSNQYFAAACNITEYTQSLTVKFEFIINWLKYWLHSCSYILYVHT